MNLPALCAEALLQPQLPDTHRQAAVAALVAFIDEDQDGLHVVHKVVAELTSDVHPESVIHGLAEVALSAASMERFPMTEVANRLDARLHTRLDHGAVLSAGRLLGRALVYPCWLPELREATLRRYVEAVESGTGQTPDEVTRDGRVLGTWCEPLACVPAWARASLRHSEDALNCLRDEQITALHAEHPTAETWRNLTRPHTFAWLRGEAVPLPPHATEPLGAGPALLDALGPSAPPAPSEANDAVEDWAQFSLLYRWERQWRFVETLTGKSRKRGIEVLRACIERTERQLVHDRARLARLSAEP